MLLVENLDELEHERVQMWELFAELMNFDVDFTFSAKELSKQLDNYSKSDLNKYLYRLSLEKALTTHGKAPNGASIYSLNQAFLSGELSE